MKNKLFRTIFTAFGISLGAFFINTDTSYAVDNEYTTSKDALYGTTYKDIFYNKTAGSPLEYIPENGVDTTTGHLTLQRTDLELLGNAGMDFSLSRYYDSNEANIGHPSVEHVEELDVENIEISFTGEDGKKHTFVVSAEIFDNHSDALKDMFIEYKEGGRVRQDTEYNTQRTQIIDNTNYNTYGISSGWSFDFPWIETMSIKEGEDSQWAKRPIYLHFGSKGSMAIATSANNDSKTYSITGLEDYSYLDVKLEDIDRTVDGVKCRYLLRDATGLRTYFNSDGVIVLQKDAHDNTILYTYTDKIYFAKIVDSVGREIVFHYGAESNGQRFLEKVTVQGEKISGGVSGKTIKYSVSETSYKPKNGKKIYGSKLNSVTVDGSKEEYGYRTVETFVNTSGWRIAAHRADTNQAYLINSVKYNGNITHYEYRAGTIRGIKDEVEGLSRDIATQFYYVTREYEQDAETKKKANGIKYDYFQKQQDRDGLVSFADGFDEIDTRQYGEDGLQNVTVVSSYNPKKHKDNGVYSDYVYEKSDINEKTLHLNKKPKKNVSLYIYNTNKLLSAEISDGSSKMETLYDYDKSGKGSLVMLATTKDYGKNRSQSPKITKEGYTYDDYRNMLTRIGSKAYLVKYKGKEHLFTAEYTYYGTDKGYPAEDVPYSLCTIIKDEEYLDSNTKTKLVSTIADNGIDYASISEQIKEGSGDYRTISKTDFTYDSKGNETKGTVYPYYGTDGTKEVIQNNYTYNTSGQQTKKTVTLSSQKNPSQNRTYTEDEITYDSFGNSLTYTTQDGLTSQNTYDEETGEVSSSKEAVGTEYESTEQQMISADGLKIMTVDDYDRCTVEFMDAFGNVVLEKDEKSGTWTESTYDYGNEDVEADDEEDEGSSQLVEEKTYFFDPEEDNYIQNEDGTQEPNYDISGKGSKVLSGTRYIYDDYGEEIVSASFSGGELDAAHCSSWTMTKETEDVEGEQTLTCIYTKELNPQHYQQQIDEENYYNQFDAYVLSETIEETVEDGEGNIISDTVTYVKGENKSETVTSYIYDAFGNTTSETTTVRKYQNGAWLPAQESQTQYQYDYQGNVTQTELQERQEGDADWETQITRSEYDSQGNVIAEYDPKGVKEGYCTRYEYDILGRQVKASIPLTEKDGTIEYQVRTTEYDDSGNITATEVQQTENDFIRTEYSYDKRGNLGLVKNCLEDGKAQYTQYAYDIEGNKIRQYTGLTSPLTLSLEEGKGENAYSYAGKDYHVIVTDKAKSDVYSETSYEYNKRDELAAYTDPEGRTETYAYDEQGNLVETVDKNGNTIQQEYDFQNRLVKSVAEDNETKKKTTHTYQYDAYGNIAKQDDTAFSYDDVSGQVTEESVSIGKGKTLVKSYAYDSGDNRTAFSVKVNGQTELAYRYAYDGAARLSSVEQTDGDETKQIAAYAYDVNGNLSGREATEAKAVTTYAYDYSNRMVDMENQANGKEVSSYQPTYLKNGQKASEESNVKGSDKKTAAYSYDLLGRLTKETKTGNDTISYTYDAHNNRKEMKVGNQITAYRYNKNEELLRADTLNTDTVQDSVTLYKYDPNGNQLAAIERQGYAQDKDEYFDLDVTLGDNRLNDNVVNHYDAQNQLTETLTGKYKVRYEYDTEGLRTSKTVNGEKTTYIWDGDRLIMELDQNGKVSRRYIYGDSLIYTDTGSGTEKQFYVMNPHGDVVQLLDESGNVIKNYEYDAFGNEINPDKKDENPFRYAGEYYDKETATIYLRARYYQPSVGRFLTRDTYIGEEDDPLSLHLYTYCGNDAINRIDPSGHIFETILDLAFLGYDLYTMITHPSWEHAASLAWDVGAVIIPGVPGSYVGKAGKAASKIAKDSKSIQKGAKYAKKAKKAVSGAKTVGKRIAKKAGSALKKRVTLVGRKLSMHTSNALNKAKNGLKIIKSRQKKYTRTLAEKSKKITRKTGTLSPKLRDGNSMKVSEALDLASEFLGKGYKEPVHGSGRFVSSDGKRVFRMGINDILGKHGGGSHVNFELLAPNPDKPGKMKVIKDIHIFLEDS